LAARAIRGRAGPPGDATRPDPRGEPSASLQHSRGTRPRNLSAGPPPSRTIGQAVGQVESGRTASHRYLEPDIAAGDGGAAREDSWPVADGPKNRRMGEGDGGDLALAIRFGATAARGRPVPDRPGRRSGSSR
jgi:hypothetical protein